MKTGDKVAHVEKSPVFRIILWTRIARETRTMWIDDRGDKWRKSTCEIVGKHRWLSRYLMSESDAQALLETAKP